MSSSSCSASSTTSSNSSSVSTGFLSGSTLSSCASDAEEIKTLKEIVFKLAQCLQSLEERISSLELFSDPLLNPLLSRETQDSSADSTDSTQEASDLTLDSSVLDYPFTQLPSWVEAEAKRVRQKYEAKNKDSDLKQDDSKDGKEVKPKKLERNFIDTIYPTQSTKSVKSNTWKPAARFRFPTTLPSIPEEVPEKSETPGADSGPDSSPDLNPMSQGAFLSMQQIQDYLDRTV
jgi:hypothetical protein